MMMMMMMMMMMKVHAGMDLDNEDDDDGHANISTLEPQSKGGVHKVMLRPERIPSLRLASAPSAGERRQHAARTCAAKKKQTDSIRSLIFASSMENHCCAKRNFDDGATKQSKRSPSGCAVVRSRNLPTTISAAPIHTEGLPKYFPKWQNGLRKVFRFTSLNLCASIKCARWRFR